MPSTSWSRRVLVESDCDEKAFYEVRRHPEMRDLFRMLGLWTAFPEKKEEESSEIRAYSLQRVGIYYKSDVWLG